MPKHLQKSLQEYLSKIKRETRNIQFSSNSFSSSKNWVLKGCRHPKTLSFSFNRRPRRTNTSKSSSSNNNNNYDDDENDSDDNEKETNDDAATLSDIDRFLRENFKSLYIKEDDDNNIKEKKKTSDEEDNEDEGSENEGGGVKSRWEPVLFGSPKLSEMPPDLPRSERFFLAPPGSSGLLSEELRPSMTATTTSISSENIASSSNYSASHYQTDDVGSTDNHEKCEEGGRIELPEGCIAVLKCTPEPHEDFRRSMLEMVEARIALRRANVDWDFMEELLLCYLDLNDKKSHRFILSAFVDLIVVLRQNEDRNCRKLLARTRSFQARERMRRRRTRTRHM